MRGPPDKRAPGRLAGSGGSENVSGVRRDNSKNSSPPIHSQGTRPDRLIAEWLSTPGLNSKQRRQIEDLGVTHQAALRAGGLGWARISTTGRGYMASDIGEVALIQPVWDGPAPSIYCAVENPTLTDLIAWRPEDPTRWHYRIGTVGAMLGEATYLEAIETRGLIKIFPTPLAWLAANCDGVCFLEDVEVRWANERFAEDEAALQAWWGEAA